MPENSNEMLAEVAVLMKRQADGYQRLETETKQLSSNLIQNDLTGIERHTRLGESELTKMRAGMMEIMSSLTKFAEYRASNGDKLDEETKEQFENCANELIESAKTFKRIAEQTANLALGGSSFSSACIQFCGVPPTTYNKPVLRYTGGNE